MRPGTSDASSHQDENWLLLLGMRAVHILLCLVCICHLLPSCDAFAIWMIDRSSSCEREMVEGEVIMSQKVISASNSIFKFELGLYRKSQGKWVQASFSKNKNTVRYLPGEEVLLKLVIPNDFLQQTAPSDVQFVIEVDNIRSAKFISGNVGCEGRRVAGYGTGEDNEIILRLIGQADIVRLSAGWATGREAVKLVEDLWLIKVGVDLDEVQDLVQRFTDSDEL